MFVFAFEAHIALLKSRNCACRNVCINYFMQFCKVKKPISAFTIWIFIVFADLCACSTFRKKRGCYPPQHFLHSFLWIVNSIQFSLNQLLLCVWNHPRVPNISKSMMWGVLSIASCWYLGSRYTASRKRLLYFAPLKRSEILNVLSSLIETKGRQTIERKMCSPVKLCTIKPFGWDSIFKY